MVLRECAGCRYWCADKELRLCAVHLSALRRFATCPTRGGLNGHGTRVALGRGRFFCESSLFRINQRYHGLGTRLWHTPPAAVKKPTEESTRERDLGASVGRDSRYGSIYVCPPLPPGPRASVLPPSSSLLPLSPPDPTPSIRPTGRWCGTRGLLGASIAGCQVGQTAACVRLVGRHRV